MSGAPEIEMSLGRSFWLACAATAFFFFAAVPTVAQTPTPPLPGRFRSHELGSSDQPRRTITEPSSAADIRVTRSPELSGTLSFSVPDASPPADYVDAPGRRWTLTRPLRVQATFRGTVRTPATGTQHSIRMTGTVYGNGTSDAFCQSTPWERSGIPPNVESSVNMSLDCEVNRLVYEYVQIPYPNVAGGSVSGPAGHFGTEFKFILNGQSSTGLSLQSYYLLGLPDSRFIPGSALSLRDRATQTVKLEHPGTGVDLNWRADIDVPWLSVTPTPGRLKIAETAERTIQTHPELMPAGKEWDWGELRAVDVHYPEPRVNYRPLQVYLEVSGPPAERVSIETGSVRPNPADSLPAEEEIAFEARVRYLVNQRESAAVALRLFDQNGTQVGGSDPRTVAKTGNQEAAVSLATAKIKLPASVSELSLKAVLLDPDAGNTVIAESTPPVKFKVAARPKVKLEALWVSRSDRGREKLRWVERDGRQSLLNLDFDASYTLSQKKARVLLGVVKVDGAGALFGRQEGLAEQNIEAANDKEINVRCRSPLLVTDEEADIWRFYLVLLADDGVRVESDPLDIPVHRIRVRPAGQSPVPSMALVLEVPPVFDTAVNYRVGREDGPWRLRTEIEYFPDNSRTIRFLDSRTIATDLTVGACG